MEEKTAIELTKEEVDLFVWVQQNWDKLFVMKNAHVFDMKNGSVVLNFDEVGMLSTIQSNRLEFKRHKIVAGAVIKI